MVASGTTRSYSYKDSMMLGGAEMDLSPAEIVQLVAEDYSLDEVVELTTEEAAPFNPKPILEILDLPVELYTQPFLWRVKGKIGSMLKIDQTTSIHLRGKFVRLCVEIDLRHKLVLAIEVLGREFRIEYESLHLICFGCGRYGHRREEFPDGGVTNAKMHPQEAMTETIPMVKANGEGLDAPNLALNNSEVVPEERGIVTASTHTPKHFEGKKEKLKLPSQEGRSKKTQTGKTLSILKSNPFAIQSKGVSKMRMERKEEESQSFEVTVNKGKEVDSSPSPAAKNRKEDDYWHSIKLIRQAQFMTGGDKLGLEGLPYVQTYLPSKEDTRAANKVNRNMGDVGTTSNPPDPGAMVDANSPVVSVSISPMVEQASTGWLRIYVVVITLIYSVYWRLVSLEQRQQTLLESLVSLLGILWKVLASLEVPRGTLYLAAGGPSGGDWTDFVHSEVIEDMLDEHVCDYAIDGRWDYERISLILGEDWLLVIATIKPPEPGFEEDSLAWLPTSNGQFLMKLVGALFFSNAEEDRSSLFRQIWKLEAPQWLRTFCWLVANEALLTNEQRCKRHMTSDDQCGVYHKFSESLLHILRDCEVARRTWMSIDNNLVTDNLFDTPLLI
ncbi:hypothetical protein Ahy_A06g029483 isoform A [Arachis hypogaea]|uniref:Reverse transcriptase zinc-binding domain-containing protein n=1 Tax=Arachis hypogaea TaxID=3818 RepID=A0A445CTG2_ARAHY|nr:hypothetical protein Ahy_A06g029483 isoform A [Arachis hypogaea]